MGGATEQSAETKNNREKSCFNKFVYNLVMQLLQFTQVSYEFVSHQIYKKILLFLQIIAACTCPDLIDQNVFPTDVNERAKRVLKGIKHSIGCYTDFIGVGFIRNSIAKYIEKRDGYPADANNIFLTNGASSAVKVNDIFFVQ